VADKYQGNTQKFWLELQRGRGKSPVVVKECLTCRGREKQEKNGKKGIRRGDTLEYRLSANKIKNPGGMEKHNLV